MGRPSIVVFTYLVTIQHPIRKSHLRCFPFAHVVTSPYKYMKTALCKQAYTIFISYICMVLNSYHICKNYIILGGQNEYYTD